MSRFVINFILVLAGCVWVGNFLAAVFTKDYQINEAINAIMLAIIGGIFSVSRKNEAERKNKRKGSPS